MDEEQIKARDIPYELGIARFRETFGGYIMALDSGHLKMFFSFETMRLLGHFVENAFNDPMPADVDKVAARDVCDRMESRC